MVLRAARLADVLIDRASARMLAERDERYRRHGGAVYLQEPNVKESAGGLRDVHTALWLASTYGSTTRSAAAK